jgi:uncharacterized protein (DUF2252 family)
MAVSNQKSPGPARRAEALARVRNLKMARSAHAYVRGSTAKFYEWLETPGRRLPAGPSVWICGDCHLGNLGPIADANGHVDVQIRDLDQTVIGNPAHDLVRLGLSLSSAARGSDLPGVTTANMLEELTTGYQKALTRSFDGRTERNERPKLIRSILGRAVRRRWRHLAEERIENVTPAIPLGKRFWALTTRERKELKRLFEEDDVRELITSLKGRHGRDEIAVLDAAYWMKGCSSLGRLRYAVIVGVGDGRSGEDDLCLIDIKEGVSTAAPRAAGAKMPRDHAERVVTGARALSPNLGERMMAGRLLDKSVILRELMPQDLKIEIDRLDREQAKAIARYLAGVVGQAHARQMDGQTRRSWSKELARNRSKTLEAPSWLWLSVVELIASHETAYLDHCRRFALDEAG